MDCATDPLALDLYAWLAGNLAQIPEGKEAFLSWQALELFLGLPGESAKELRGRAHDSLSLTSQACSLAHVWLTDEGPFAQRSQMYAGAEA